MRVLFDTYWWGTGPVSGQVVVRELLAAWIREFPGDDLVLATRPEARGEVSRAFGGLPTVPVRGRPHGVATLLQYGWWARRTKADVAFTQNFAPPGIRCATFIHDVMYQTNPEWFTRSERAYFWLIPRFARTADLVVTSSQHEVDRIRACNPSLRNVQGIGLSVATALTGATPTRPDVVPDGLPFLLTVGRLNIRKNLALTLEATLASGRISPELPLVVVASRDGKDVPLPASVERAAREGSIRFVPRVTDAELAWLYRHAELFLYLSLDEGFGLPPLEALSFGCPVLVSDIDVFRELLGDHATYCDPRDIDDATSAILAADSRRLDPAPGFAGWDDCVRRLRAAIAQTL